MPAAQSADGLSRAMRVREVVRAAHFSTAQKVLLLSLNAWPFLHLLTVAAWVALPSWNAGFRAAGAAMWLLLAPPLLCRLIVGGGLNSGVCGVPSRTFFLWWGTWQLQMIFNRLPWIEEAMRLVPGLYSAWLRLWGASVGRLTLWSPGARAFDRPLLRIGDDVVIGIDARIVGHFGGVDRDGAVTLALGAVTLGDRTTVGGSALLGAGFVLESDQATEALFLGMPFTRWHAGKRVRGENELSVPRQIDNP